MKRKLSRMAWTAFLTMAVVLTARADNDLRVEAERALSKFKQTDPNLQRYFDTAAGYAVFPGVGKGGLIIGGAHGKGLVYQKGVVIGEASLTEASIGLQAGGVSFDELIFFETPAVLDEFKQGKFSLGADANAVVATTDAKAGAGAQTTFNQGVAIFTMPKSGAMAAASVGGQKFSFTPLSQP